MVLGSRSGNLRFQAGKILKYLIFIGQERLRILYGLESADSSSISPLAEARCCIRVSKSDHTTLAHWQLAQASSRGVLGSSSVRIPCGLI
jgi:hypothetical protein